MHQQPNMPSSGIPSKTICTLSVTTYKLADFIERASQIFRKFPVVTLTPVVTNFDYKNILNKTIEFIGSLLISDHFSV